MLLANMAVARKIERHYRKTALLRMHPPPKVKVLREAVRFCSAPIVIVVVRFDSEMMTMVKGLNVGRWLILLISFFVNV